MSPKSRRLTAATGAALAVLLAVTPVAGAVAPRGGRATAAPAGPSSAKPDFDVRTRAVTAASRPGVAPLRALAAGDRAARGRLVARLGGQAILSADPLTATPRALGRLDGTLTGRAGGDPGAIALRYVGDHAGAFGLDTADLSTLHESGRTTADGVTYVRWRQEHAGVPLLDNELRASVDGDGRVVSVLGAPRSGVAVASTTPRLGAAQALGALAANVGIDRGATVTAGPTGPREETTFSTGDRASLVLFGDTGAVRLAWRLTYHAASDAWYDVVVDATTGAILHRVNMVKPIVDASVFENHPGAALGGVQHTVSLDPYLTNPATATALDGPFAHAWSDIDDASASAVAETPQPTEEVVPAPYPFSSFNATNTLGACDATHPCSWDAGIASSWDTNRAQNATQVFWYVNRFHDHLAAAPIGFDAASGNFEAAGGDAVRVETDDGANLVAGFPDGNHLDNANMTTLPDGQPPVMQMYLFLNIPATSPFRDVNGGDDASVVYHEYAHGLSNRLITDAVGGGALNLAQSAAMGEAWSDFYAKDFVVGQFPGLDTAANGEVSMGAYVDSPPNQIRTQPLDCPVGAAAPACPGTAGAGGPGGYTYGDFAKILPVGAEVHADGEIWGETLWDLRRALGSPVTEAIVTGGMRQTPAEPSFLDARNAILLADQALFAGVHQDAIWAVFAHRGMGLAATTAGGNDIAPVEDFTTPAPTNTPPPPPASGVTTPTPAAPAVPAGGATPLVVPASAVARVQAVSRPSARVDRSTVAGRTTFTVGCATTCRATATMTVSAATARRVGLGRTRRLGRVTRRMTGPSRRTFPLAISSASLRRVRAKGVLSLPVSVSVAVRDGAGQTRTVRRTLTVRVQ